MRQQAVSWFHGWKITLKCTGFECQDGSRRFASSAILQHVPMQSAPGSLHWPDTQRNARVHTEEAFCTCDEAHADALQRARTKIFELDSGPTFSGSDTMEQAQDTGAGEESDEALAARFEITFDGKRYAFRQYHYDRFEDALRYAAMEHARPTFVQDAAFEPHWLATFHPSDVDESVMKMHGIAYGDGYYLFAGYRYSQLVDAVAYAARHPAH